MADVTRTTVKLPQNFPLSILFAACHTVMWVCLWGPKIFGDAGAIYATFGLGQW